MRLGMFAVVAVVSVGIGLTGPAMAQPASTTKADLLFNQGRDLLEAGKFKEACERFEASLREADALGTRLNLALCMEKRGRVHSALEKFEDAALRADRDHQPDSAKVAREHVEALKLLVPRLTVQITNPAPGQRVVISRPGERDIEVNGTEPVAIDPTDIVDESDRITISAEAPGRVKYTSEPRTIALRARETVVVPELAKAGEGAVGGAVTGGGGSNRKLYGIITGATGIAMMAVGGIWGYTARSKLDEACKEQPGCYDADGDFTAADLPKSAKGPWKQLHIYAPTVFLVGVAAVGVATYLYLSAPKRREQTATRVVPTVNAEGGGIAVLGHF